MLRFGTDGVRGVAGRELTPELVLALGRAAARTLSRPGGSFLVGRDTRLSGPMLQAAFSAGLAAEGVDVVDLGVLPTPGVAATAAERAVPAAVVSASHNPYRDNGVKLLSSAGRKLGEVEEEAVESLMGDLLRNGEGAARADPSGPSDSSDPSGPSDPSVLGRLQSDPAARDAYCARLVAALEGRRLGGMRVAVDCGNGAAVSTAVEILSAAGAELVAVIGAEPDGTNINAGCGSTDPGPLAAVVLRHGAAAGLAFDGDADRVIAVDDRGEVVDGDRLIALFARDLQDRGRLAGSTVVVTLMTNLGFHRAMEAAGITVVQTPVGDRSVAEALDSEGWSLGGEQSGHVVFPELATTGDGVLTGLLLVELLARQGEPLSKLAAAAMTRLPQVLRSVRVDDPSGLEGAATVWREVAGVERELGGDGRVVLRASGTEPVVRVMVEAATESEAAAAAGRLESVVLAALGGRAG